MLGCFPRAPSLLFGPFLASSRTVKADKRSSSQYDAQRVERIRRGSASEADDRAARYLIDEAEKACLRDPDASSLGPRYDAVGSSSKRSATVSRFSGRPDNSR